MLDLIPQLAVLQEQAYDRGPLLIATSAASVFAGQNAGALSTASKGSHLRIPGGKLTVSAFNAIATIALKSISTSFLLNEGTVPGPSPPILPSLTIPLEGLSPTTTFFDPRFQPLLHESILFVAGITLATGAGVLLVLNRGVFIVEFGNGGTKKGGKRICNGGCSTGKASGSGQAPDGEPGDRGADNGTVDKAADGNEGDGGSAPPLPPPPGGGGNDIESDFPANTQGIPLWQILLMLAGLGFTTREIVKITRAWVKKHKSGRLTLPHLPKFSVNFTLSLNTSDTLPFASRLDAASVLITSDIPKFLSPAPPVALRLAPSALPEVIESRPVRGLIEFVTSTLSNVNPSPIYPNAAQLSRICPASPIFTRLSPNLLPIQLAQNSFHGFGKAILPLSSLSTLPALPKSTLAPSLPTTLINALPTATFSKLLPTTTTLASVLPRSTNTVPEAYRRFTLASALPKSSYTTVPEAFRRFTLSAPRPKSIPTFSIKVPLSKSAITNSLPKPTTTTCTPTLIRATLTIKATFTAAFHKAQTTTISKGFPKATVIKRTFFRVIDTPIRYTTSSERPTKSLPLRLLRAFLDRYPCATVTGQVVRTLATVAAACVVIVSCKLVIAFLQWMVRLERERDAARFKEVVEVTWVDEQGVAAAVEEKLAGEEGDSEVTLYVDEPTGIMEPDVVLPLHVSLDFEHAHPAYGFTTSTPWISRVMHAREVEVREEVAVTPVEEECVVERQVDVSGDGDHDVVEEDSELVGASVEVHVSEESTEVEERVEAEDDENENGAGDGVVDVCASDEEEGDSQASEACSEDDEDVEEEEDDDDDNEEGFSGVAPGDAEEEEGDEGMDSFGLAEVEADNDADSEMESFGLVEVAVDEDNQANEEEEITPPDVATEEDDNEDDNEEEMASSGVATEEEGEDKDKDDAESAIDDEEEEGGDDNANISCEAEVYETVATASVSVEDANNDAPDEAAGISLESEVAIDPRNHNEPEHDAESSDTSNVLADLEKVEKKRTPKWKTLMDEINIAPPVRYPDLFDGETDTKKIVRGLLDGVHKKRAAPVKQHFDDDEEDVDVVSEGEEQKRLIERLDDLYEEAVETKASFSAEFEHDRPMIVQQWGSQHEWLNRDRPRREERLSTAGTGQSRLGGDPQTV